MNPGCEYRERQNVAAGFSLRLHRRDACATKASADILVPKLPLGNQKK